MTKDSFHEKIALILSFLILNNYLLLSLNFPQLLIKINFLIFLVTVFIFYSKNFLENPFLKDDVNIKKIKTNEQKTTDVLDNTKQKKRYRQD